jgi:hypothetical protein
MAATVEAIPIPPDPVPPGTSPTAPTNVEPTTQSGTTARAVAVPIFELPPEGTPIPARALAAYQRSETIIGRAAPDCAMDWQLLGAIAGVLTGHGEADGEYALDDDGLVQPSIIGPPLLDSDEEEVADTDGGLLDEDPFRDRPVGPFLFDPAVWTVVGVDADGDGRRDPQGIDDAALAASVLLCAGGNELVDEEASRAALTRFGIEDETADQVLITAEEYREGLHQPTSEVPFGFAHGLPTPPLVLLDAAPAVPTEEDPAPQQNGAPSSSGKLNESDASGTDDVVATAPAGAGLTAPPSEPKGQPSPERDKAPVDSGPVASTPSEPEASTPSEPEPAPAPAPDAPPAEPAPAPEPAPAEPATEPEPAPAPAPAPPPAPEPEPEPAAPEAGDEEEDDGEAP